jgi:hypothetical protein
MTEHTLIPKSGAVVKFVHDFRAAAAANGLGIGGSQSKPDLQPARRLQQVA